MEGVFVLVGALVIWGGAVFLMVYGGLKAFQRNWLLFVLLFIFFTPGLFVWVLIECLTGPVSPKVHNVRIVNDPE